MSFNQFYRLSVHAVIFNDHNEVLLLKQTYGDKRWGLPGGAVDKGETIFDAIQRECFEELGIFICINGLSGIYYHEPFESHAILFNCSINLHSQIKLSDEHSDYAWFQIEDLGEIQKKRIKDALIFSGNIATGAFYKNPMDKA